MLVSNDFEHSVSISRGTANTVKSVESSKETCHIDVCVFRHGELTIALNNGSDEPREIDLSPDEARQLREHLNDPETLKILGICDITTVKCPGCSRMVADFQRHSCVQ